MLIDATAVPADRGGVGRYVDSLVAALDADGARLSVVCQPRDA
ncbi:MAG: glycosyltransferase family 1 protein, partial [Saccharothrix sp.]|nr:glycosyltransferase family 1 protein [Saccharothrix sp.]